MLHLVTPHQLRVLEEVVEVVALFLTLMRFLKLTLHCLVQCTLALEVTVMNLDSILDLW